MGLKISNDPDIKRFQEQIVNNKQEKEVANAKITTLSEELTKLKKEYTKKEHELINAKNNLQIFTQNISSLTSKLTNRQLQLEQQSKLKINEVITKINNVLRLDPPGHALSCQFLDSANAFQVLYAQAGKDTKIIGDFRQDDSGVFNIHKISDCGSNFEATLFWMQKINLIFNQIKTSF